MSAAKEVAAFTNVCTKNHADYHVISSHFIALNRIGRILCRTTRCTCQSVIMADVLHKEPSILGKKKCDTAYRSFNEHLCVMLLC